MKVLIDIPEELYSRMVQAKCFADIPNALYDEDSLGRIFYECAKSGIVLPKGYGDLIERDKLRQSIKENLIDTSKVHYESLIEAEGVNCGVESSLDDVNNAPVVIPADKGMCYNCQYKTDSCQEGLHCIRDSEG